MKSPLSDTEPASDQDREGLPRHIAIIMDGNNRWARLHDQKGLAGHRAGATAARKVIRACGEKGIHTLTLFAFSSENWERPQKEVSGLMALFVNMLHRDEVRQLHENDVRLCFIGRRDRFSKRLQRLMHDAEAMTSSNNGLNLVVAADYGGQWDITEAARKLAVETAEGRLDPARITASMLAENLSLSAFPSPDLCIRTGGEQRISNFLLWQFAYTELYFSDLFWPDFDEAALDLALADYDRRQRRFGKTADQVTARSQVTGGER